MRFVKQQFPGQALQSAEKIDDIHIVAQFGHGD
jgi:hypothetical protein